MFVLQVWWFKGFNWTDQIDNFTLLVDGAWKANKKILNDPEIAAYGWVLQDRNGDVDKGGQIINASSAAQAEALTIYLSIKEILKRHISIRGDHGLVRGRGKKKISISRATLKSLIYNFMYIFYRMIISEVITHNSLYISRKIPLYILCIFFTFLTHNSLVLAENALNTLKKFRNIFSVNKTYLIRTCK